LLRGNPGLQKINEDEPVPARPPAVPEPPDFLRGYACDEWCRVAPELHVLGLLTAVDVMPLAAYCSAYARWQDAEEVLRQMAMKNPVTGVTGALLIKTSAGDARANPLIRIADRAAADMIRYASEFGLTPAARARIRAGVAWRDDGKFDGLID
jgi:P27 family predicted phage terminase small subunit